MTWHPLPVDELRALRPEDAFLGWAPTPDSLAVSSEDGWGVLLPWRPTGHWGGGSFVREDAPADAESRAFALLAAMAQERGVLPEWFSTAPGRELQAPPGIALGESGRWTFMSTTSSQRLPTGGGAGLVELDDSADAAEIEAFGRAHNPNFEGFPGRGYASLWLGVREGEELIAVGGLHTLASGAPHVSGLVVRGDLRGRGLGAALTGELTRRALNTAGVSTLGVYTANERAIRLYSRLGYAASHHFDTRDLSPLGPAADR